MFSQLSGVLKHLKKKFMNKILKSLEKKNYKNVWITINYSCYIT